MAETIRADRNASETGKSAARAKAEAAFSKPADAAAAPPRVLENVATESDAQRLMPLIINAERDKEAFEATARAAKAAQKAKYDKVYTDVADALKSRGVTKRILRETYEISRRKDEENRAEFQAKLWLLRASGIEVGQQLGFFEDGFSGQDEVLRRARQQGYDAFTDKKPDSANPYHPSSAPGQKWIEGYNAAGADSMRTKSN